MKPLDKCVFYTMFLLAATYLLLSYSSLQIFSRDNEPVIINDSESIQYTYKSSDALKRRAFRVTDICSKNPELRNYMPKRSGKTQDWVYNAYLKHERQSLLYCPVPKCGWSSWRTMFFQTLHEGDKNEAARILQDDTRTGWRTPWDKIDMSIHTLFEAKEISSSSLEHKMIFVRDPYDRLVSAYNDKAVRNEGLYTKQEKLPCKWIKQDSPILTFKQFISCILDNARSHSNNSLGSFSAGELLDMHWRPQSLLCNVCVINFNIIGHFHHMNEDIGEALHLLNMDTKPSWTNVAGRRRSLAKYYNQLSNSQLEDFKLLYKYDFEIFDFRLSPPAV